MFHSFDLKGKTAIVTGSTRGIGCGIAMGFADAGSDVVIVSRNEADCDRIAAQIAGKGVKAIAVPADITHLSEIDRVMEKTMAVFGKIDILVNNAGNALTKRAEDITEEDWDRVLNLDLKAVFFCCQGAGRIMIEQKRGKIINVASILGLVGEKLVAPYCAAKGGVLQLTKALALEWARYNVQVNALCPGYIETSINTAELQNPKVRDYITGRTAVKRLGSVQDMVGASLLLASDASDYMTGQTITIDGGWTAQ